MVTKLRTKPTKVSFGVSRLGNPYFASYFSTNEHTHNLSKREIESKLTNRRSTCSWVFRLVIYQWGKSQQKLTAQMVPGLNEDLYCWWLRKILHHFVLLGSLYHYHYWHGFIPQLAQGCDHRKLHDIHHVPYQPLLVSKSWDDSSLTTSTPRTCIMAGPASPAQRSLSFLDFGSFKEQ